MVKWSTTAFSLLLSLAATLPAAAQKRGHSTGATNAKAAITFLDAIEVAAVDLKPPVTIIAAPEAVKVERQPVAELETSPAANIIETVTALQLKYGVLLDTEVEQIQNTGLFSAIDEWYGTRYILGGSSKDGIDCSAFVQTIYSQLFQIPMPRTAKEQYAAVRLLSRTELKQGDLVFFNTRGKNVSHVGIYLQNNKFVHAATSGGVMVSDLLEEYWVKHFAGAGRYDAASQVQTQLLKP